MATIADVVTMIIDCCMGGSDDEGEGWEEFAASFAILVEPLIGSLDREEIFKAFSEQGVEDVSDEGIKEVARLLKVSGY
jgi:hypothetical protein